MATRSENPAPGCLRSKEELISDGFKYTDDCKICHDDYNVLCRVAKHASHPLSSAGNSVYFLDIFGTSSSCFKIQNTQEKFRDKFELLVSWKN